VTLAIEQITLVNGQENHEHCLGPDHETPFPIVSFVLTGNELRFGALLFDKDHHDVGSIEAQLKEAVNNHVAGIPAQSSVELKVPEQATAIYVYKRLW
jgi:hypothetical protein